MIEKIIEVTENDTNTRLDTYVSSLNLALSRSMVKKLITNGKIFVNEKIVKESYKIKNGDKVKEIIEPPKETKLEAQEIPLDIIYEDNDIIVINKEKGMVVHPRKWQ